MVKLESLKKSIQFKKALNEKKIHTDYFSIYAAKNFLKPGGYLIIEDIFSKKKMYSEKKFYDAIKSIKSEFDDIFFINCKNKYNYAGIWFNHKILVFIKK